MSGCCCADAAVERHATAAKARERWEYFMGFALHDRLLTSYQSRQVDAIRSFIALGPRGARQSRRIGAKRSRRESPVWVCAVTRQRFPTGVRPARKPLQPEATGGSMSCTTRSAAAI